jgi:hypothetical protein
MCGRTRLSSDLSEIRLVLSIPPDAERRAEWNVAPTYSLQP